MRLATIAVALALLIVPLTSLADDGAIQLTFGGTPERGLRPHWSPDGNLIVFDDYYYADSADIWVIPSTGGTATQVPGITGDIAFDPCWSPDGSKIAFLKYRPPRPFLPELFDIAVVDYPGGSEYHVTNSWSTSEWNPSWSPDGSLIAFNRFDVFTVPASGGTPTLVTTNGRYPIWSPDGSLIAFSRLQTGYWDIWVIPASGGAATQTHWNGVYQAWSPDGSQIAYAKETDGNWDIWVRPATLGSPQTPPTRITTDPATDLEPCWSPDGSQIAFSRNHQVWTITVPEPVAVVQETWGMIKGKYR